MLLFILQVCACLKGKLRIFILATFSADSKSLYWKFWSYFHLLIAMQTQFNRYALDSQVITIVVTYRTSTSDYVTKFPEDSIRDKNKIIGNNNLL